MNGKNNCFKNNCYILGPTGPTGPPGSTIVVNSTKTGLPGTEASVTNSGTLDHVLLDFVIPRGEIGKAPTFQIGTVTTSKPGSDAAVTLTPIDQHTEKK